jgi:hypothetical protein
MCRSRFIEDTCVHSALFEGSLSNLAADAVQVTAAILGDAAATEGRQEKINIHHLIVDVSQHLPIWCLFEHTNLLEGLQGLALDSARSISVVGWASTAVNATAIQFAQSTNTDAVAQINVASNGGSMDVEPVWIIWSQLFVCTILNDINPLWDFEFAAALQMSSISLYERMRVDILDGGTASHIDLVLSYALVLQIGSSMPVHGQINTTILLTNLNGDDAKDEPKKRG